MFLKCFNYTLYLKSQNSLYLIHNWIYNKYNRLYIIQNWLSIMQNRLYVIYNWLFMFIIDYTLYVIDYKLYIFVLAKILTVVNQTSSVAPTNLASWKRGVVIQTTTLEMALMKRIVPQTSLVHHVNIITSCAIRATSAYQEATIAIWRELVKMIVTK